MKYRYISKYVRTKNYEIFLLSYTYMFVGVTALWFLHLTLFAPLKSSRLDANARGTLAVARQDVVGSSYELSCRIKATAYETHSWIGGYATAFVFAKV